MPVEFKDGVPQFYPHLRRLDDGMYFGRLGRKTAFVDYDGHRLCVGDLCAVYHKNGVFLKMGWVVHPKKNPSWTYVRGMSQYCKPHGVLQEGYLLSCVLPWTSLQHKDHLEGVYVSRYRKQDIEWTPKILDGSSASCGELGSMTKLKTTDGTPLRIGDRVLVTAAGYYKHQIVIRHPTKNYDVISGIVGSCGKTGTINAKYEVKMYKEWTQLPASLYVAGFHVMKTCPYKAKPRNLASYSHTPKLFSQWLEDSAGVNYGPVGKYVSACMTDKGVGHVGDVVRVSRGDNTYGTTIIVYRKGKAMLRGMSALKLSDSAYYSTHEKKLSLVIVKKHDELLPNDVWFGMTVKSNLPSQASKPAPVFTNGWDPFTALSKTGVPVLVSKPVLKPADDDPSAP